ncbi:MAG: DUF86 domain-containing protein [Oscillospiraceae bacterium]|nr:DUF86 domain-containing protein [Oscillospiraceae bacterium]
MDKKDRIVLLKILSETSVISDLIADFDCDAFQNDEKTKRAVCMTLINIGELVKLVSDQEKQSCPAIPWRSIAGLRDVTAHGYQTLRMEDIWVTVTTDIPRLCEQIKELLDRQSTQ